MKNIKRRILGFILSFSLVLGMFPGMSLTAYADNTEELLTTLTFGGSSTYSETKSGVVSVTATNVTSYSDAYGWLFFDVGSLSVTAEEGYTINKCVFRQNNKQPITDTEAPFEIHSSDRGCITEDTNWDMDGVTSIEVYGYASKAAQTITAEDVTVTYGDTDKSVSATVTEPTTGGGEISYVVKSGSEDYIDVASDGKLTIKKVPSDGKAYVTVTAAATDDYAQATKEVTVTINTKAMTVSAEDVNATVDGQSHGITVNVTDPASGATVKYGTEEGSYTLDASPTQTEVGTQTVYYQVTADNYTTYIGSATVTVSDKGTQTITASDVTATYGDTNKKVEATTDGNGAISYAVKDGSADYIDVDASTGTLTIKKVGTATVIVTAAETATYAKATKEVTVTINKANAVAATVTANNRTYDGTDKPLVNVDNSTLVGGEMWYALGENATTAPEDNLYTTSIPTKTNVGTYYVWYMVKGDLNHYDSEPRCVTVNIANALYTVTSVENWEHTIDYPNDIIITVKRNAADNITYSMYTGASVDGNGIPAGGSSVAQGSLILTLKGSYLDTLSTGTHKVTISFKDGSADASISIVNAPPAPTAAPTHVPKTGDGANLVLWIGLILLGFLGIIAFAGMAGRKHRNR